MAKDDDAYISAAMAALESWDITIQTAEVHSRSENVVIRLTDRTEALYALRIHRPGYNTIDELKAEVIWETALNRDGIRTPPHVLTRDGDAYVEVSLHNRPHQVGMIRWIPGRILGEVIQAGDAEEQFQCFSALGGLIASLHEHTSSWRADKPLARRSWNADGLMGEYPLWGKFWEAPFLNAKEAREFYKARGRIHEQLRLLTTDSASYGLIHADLHPRNVIVHKEELQAIDFDDAGYGWYVYDLAVALREFVDHERYDQFRDALLDGYRARRSLPDVEALLPLFLCVRGLISIGWAAARPEIVDAKKMKPLVAAMVDSLKLL